MIEALVATAILTLLVGAMFDVVNPTRGTFQVQTETGDLQQRFRAGVDAISAAIRTAGAGPLVGVARGPLGRSLPPIVPYRFGRTRSDPDSGVWYRPGVISVIGVPRTAAQATLRDAVDVGAISLTVVLPASCPPATAMTICGFGSGTHVAVLDGSGTWDLVTVERVAGNVLTLAEAGGLSAAFGPGAVVTEVVLRSLALKVDASGMPQLSQYDGFQSEFPVVDNVTTMSFEYFGDPLPPQRLDSAPLSQPIGPWTTYGPRPPEIGIDDLRDTWPPGENCMFQVVDGRHVPRLPTLGSGPSLVRLDANLFDNGPWCPDAASARAYDADVLRIRRVRVHLRLQVASGALRGPVGAFFSRGGYSTAPDRLVPDQEITFDIVPPNAAMGH